jgi:hypothetical protein
MQESKLVLKTKRIFSYKEKQYKLLIMQFLLHIFKLRSTTEQIPALVQTKNPNLSKIWRSLEWKMFGMSCGNLEHTYITAIWYTL